MSKGIKNLDKDFLRKLITLVLPIAFQQFMLALVSASDVLMLGELSQSALSAVSLATQITFVQNLFLAAMTIGLSVLAAQYWGKKDVKTVEKIFAYVLKITVLISAVFAAAAFLVPTYLMRIFTQDALLVEEGAVYLRVVSVSYLLTGISQIYLCILKNSGKAFKSSIISSVSVLVNIALNAMLIFGLLGMPKLQIAGAALATVIARVVEVVWCILETGKKDRVKLRYANFKKDAVLCRDFWNYTFPILGNEIVWGCGFTMYSVIMGHLGSDAVAASSIANTVKNLLVCFCLGLASGGGIIVGNELGAGRLEAAKNYGRKLCKMALICGAASGVLLLALVPFILGAVNLSGQSLFYLKWMLIMCSYYLIGKSINTTTIAGIFCAGGDSKFGLLCDVVVMWGIMVPMGLIAAFVLKLPVPVVYFLLNLDEILKLPAVYRHYKKYKWVKDLTIKEEIQE